MISKDFLMRDLLSDHEIQAMRKELISEVKLPIIPPPSGREYWSVHRIVETLEYFQDIEKKYNKVIFKEKASGEQTGGIINSSFDNYQKILHHEFTIPVKSKNKTVELKAASRENAEKYLSEKDIADFNDGDKAKVVFPNGDFMIYGFEFITTSPVVDGLHSMKYGNWVPLEYHSEFERMR